MAEQSFLVIVSKKYDSETRRIIGQTIVNFIVNRTNAGLDKFNRPFKRYSKEYADSLEFAKGAKDQGQVNLRLTGEMLGSLSVISTGSGFVKIGFDQESANDKAEFSKENGRELLGITDKDLRGILSGFPIIEPINANVSPSIARPLVRGFDGR